MQKKWIIRLGIPAIILTLSVLLLSYGSVEKPMNSTKDTKSTCCKKIKRDCSNKQVADDMPFENLSRQFISFSQF